MSSFNVANHRIDIVANVRVRGEYFPKPAGDLIGDYFLVDIYDRKTDEPVNMYPREIKPIQNRLTIGWVGLARIPIYTSYDPDGEPIGPIIGSRRGGDFRLHFWQQVARHIAQARAGALLNKSNRDVQVSDIYRYPRLRRIFEGRYRIPYDPTTQSIDEAIEHITGLPPQEAEAVPYGTTVTIDADASIRAKYEDPSTYTALTTSGQWAAEYTGAQHDAGAIRFPLSSITDGSTVTQVGFQALLTSRAAAVVAGEGATLSLYNNTGDDDPSADTAQTLYNRCLNGTGLWNIDCATVASKENTDIGATVESALQGNLTSPDRITLALRAWNLDNADYCIFERVSLADPPTLTVIYTAPAVYNYAGSQPASSGVLTRRLLLKRNLAGSQPASSGAVVKKPNKQLTGSQPASSGLLARRLFLFRALAGAQPAASSVLAALQLLKRALTGSQPASSGIEHEVQYGILGGTQPYSTGTLLVNQISRPTSSTAGNWTNEGGAPNLTTAVADNSDTTYAQLIDGADPSILTLGMAEIDAPLMPGTGKLIVRAGRA